MSDAELLREWPGEYWRLKGLEVVMRLAGPLERMEAAQRAREVIEVRQRNEAWLRQKLREAA